MTIEVSGWGRFPVAQAKPLILKDSATLSETLRKSFRGIAYGMGRSYGDSALSEQVVFTHSYNHFIDIDSKNGHLSVQAGTTLK